MSQMEITRILQNRYPKYMSYKEIIVLIELNPRTVMRNLRSLQKRNEVEVRCDKEDSKLGPRWITRYRIKKE